MNQTLRMGLVVLVVIPTLTILSLLKAWRDAPGPYFAIFHTVTWPLCDQDWGGKTKHLIEPVSSITQRFVSLGFECNSNAWGSVCRKNVWEGFGNRAYLGIAGPNLNGSTKIEFKCGLLSAP